MDLSVVVNDIIKNAEKAVRRDLEDNKLIECLYCFYCRITKKNETFDDRLSSSDEDIDQVYADVASELYTWYDSRYSKHFKMKKGGRGSQGLRTVTSAHTYQNARLAKKKDEKSMYGAYGFSQLYAQNQFLSKFATTSSSEKGQPYMDFILHCCVAFLVSPEKVDELLLHYGFARLHIRNVHHMAIYTVLNSAQSMTPAEIDSFNPFAEIESLYAKARDILNNSSTDDTDIARDYIIAGTKTNWISNYLVSRHLSTDNMLRYISSNKSLFTMRHSLILRDFWKYSRLYTHIYYEYGHRNPDGLEWYNDEENYSLYMFMKKFCVTTNYAERKTFPAPKRFNYILFTEVEKNQKHPSREFMIIIWLYNYCFASMNSLEISRYTVNKLSESYMAEINDGILRDNAGEKARVIENYNDGKFSISKFIFNNTASCSFLGGEVVNSIQKKLTEYGWGPLNENRAFDNYILALKSLKIQYNRNYQKNAVYWKNEYISLIDSKNNIPDSLLVVTALFDEIQKTKNTSSTPYFPLSCRIYEQI